MASCPEYLDIVYKQHHVLLIAVHGVSSPLTQGVVYEYPHELELPLVVEFDEEFEELVLLEAELELAAAALELLEVVF